MQFTFLSELKLERNGRQPMYLQLSQGLADLIKRGMLKPGQKLPGTRQLAQQLSVHRSTLMLALEELQAEGWLVARERSGWYVNQLLPFPHEPTSRATGFAKKSGVEVMEIPSLDFPKVSHLPLQFDDGYPDHRIAPLKEFGRAYRRLLSSQSYRRLFYYSSPQGDEKLRSVLSETLTVNRGLSINSEQVFITRGSIMGLYLLSGVLLWPGDSMVVGELSYRTANLIFQHAGCHLLRIPVDEEGIQTEALAALLEQQHIRAIYVTSHHHYPTTVPLAPHRRLHLYELAKKYRFLIIEDDYDYDFHYDHQPLMPIAAMDNQGLVIYIGSFTKKISPAIRVGFVVAPQNILQEMVKLRRIVDRQGSNLEDRALADLLEDGTIKRFTRKALQTYRERRDLFCTLLREKLAEHVSFRAPEGGLAVWARFNQNIPLPALSEACQQQGLYLSDGKIYNPEEQSLNACRMGFASMNLKEIEQAVTILSREAQGFL